MREAPRPREQSCALALQDLQDGAENGCGCHRPGVWLVQPCGTDVTGSSSSGLHVPGGLGCSFCALGGPGSGGAVVNTSHQGREVTSHLSLEGPGSPFTQGLLCSRHHVGALFVSLASQHPLRQVGFHFSEWKLRYKKDTNLAPGLFPWVAGPSLTHRDSFG